MICGQKWNNEHSNRDFSIWLEIGNAFGTQSLDANAWRLKHLAHRNRAGEIIFLMKNYICHPLNIEHICSLCRMPINYLLYYYSWKLSPVFNLFIILAIGGKKHYLAKNSASFAILCQTQANEVRSDWNFDQPSDIETGNRYQW